MADNGYSDGSVVVSTELDPKGFEAGSDRMKDAVKSSTERFQDLGEQIKESINQGVQAVQDAAPVIEETVRKTADYFKYNSESIQRDVDSWANAIPQKKFESNLSELQKMLSELESKFVNVSQAYANATNGGSQDIAKFEKQAVNFESSLDAISGKLEQIYGAQVKVKDNELFSAKDDTTLSQIISKYDSITARLGDMQTEVIKVKSATEEAKRAAVEAAEAEKREAESAAAEAAKAKAAEAEARAEAAKTAAAAKAELNAAKESTRQFAEENKQSWQTVRNEIKTADTEARAFNSSYNSLSNSVQALENKVLALGPAAKNAMSGSESAVDSFNFKVANVQRTIQMLRERMEALGNTQVPTVEYSELQQSISATRAELDRLLAAKQRMLSSNTDQTSDEWRQTEAAIANVRLELQGYEQQKLDMENNGTNVISGAETDAYRALSDQINVLENDVSRYENRVSSASTKTSIMSATLRGLKAAGKVGSLAFTALGKTISAVTDKIKAFTRASNNPMAAVKKLTSVFTSFGSRIKSMLKRRFITALFSGATEGIKNLVQVSPQLNASISSIMSALEQLKNSFATAFAPIITTVAPLITKFINLMSAAFTKVGMFIAALTGAKTFKRAVAVQRDYAASLKDTSDETDKLSDSNKKDATTADKKGVNKATKAQKKYNDTLEDTADAAEELDKSLAGFDELNNTTSSGENDLDFDIDLPETEFDPADILGEELPIDLADELFGDSIPIKTETLFEDVPIDSKILDIVSKIKELIANGDWEGLGDLIADKINGVFQKINDFVDWENVGPKITAFIEGFTQLFNSLVENIDWALIGDTIGKAVNTIVNSLYLLVTGIDWGNLGKQLMTGLNAIISEIDWKKLGATIGASFQAVISFLHSVVHNFDYKSLAKGLADGINGAVSSIDWAMLGDTVSTAVKNALDFLIAFLDTIDWYKIGESVAIFLNNIDWGTIIIDVVKFIVSFLEGAIDILTGFIETLDWKKLGTDICNILSQVVTDIDWIGLIHKAFELLGAAFTGLGILFTELIVNLGNLLEAAWEATKDYFDERINKAGGDIGLGILQGIADALSAIGAWIKENIFDPFMKGFCEVFGIRSPSTVMAEMGGYIIAGLKNGITAAWTGIKKFFSDAWDTIKNGALKAWTKIKADCTAAWKFVTDTISNTCLKIKNIITEKFTAAKNKILEIITLIKNLITSGFTYVYNTVTTKLTNVKDKVFGIFSSIYSSISNKVGSIKTSISNGFSSMYSTVRDKVSDIASSVSGKFSDLISDAWDWGADIIDNLIRGIDSCVSSVQDKVSEIANTIKDFLGFSEPKKGPLSDFHTYMPDMIDLMAEGIEKNKGTAINAVSKLAGAVSDEAQGLNVLLPIDAEGGYTRVLNSFSDTITDAFTDLITKLEAIAENVTFAIPAIAEGTVIPYNIAPAPVSQGDEGRHQTISGLAEIIENVKTLANKLDDVVDAIDNKETGITDEAVYTSVKKSARREKKSTGRNPFTD